MNEYSTGNLSQSARDLPTWRLHAMRCLYFLNFISLGFDSWSQILFPQVPFETLSGVSISFWAGFSLLNAIGIRFPLKMIPLLLLQLLYKSAWIIGTYLPAKHNDLLNAELQSFLWICVAGMVLNLLIIPWGYVYHHLLKGFLKFRLKG